MSVAITSKEFQSLIGGVDVSPEEKAACLELIKQAIIKNNQGNSPMRLSHKVFASSYPDSLSFVKEYYDSLYIAEVVNIKGWDGEKYVNRNQQKVTYRNIIKRKMLETLIIFAPELINKEPSEISEMFAISANEVSSLLNNYRKVFNQVPRIKDLGQEDEKYRLARTIYEEIVINGMRKQEFCQKYKMSAETVDNHIELLKEIDESLYNGLQITLGQNSSKRFQELKALTLKIADYSKNKIAVTTSTGTFEMPFTMLDYYSLTNYSPKTLIEFVNDAKNFDSSNKEEMVKRAVARQMLHAQRTVMPQVSKEQILKYHMAVGKEGNMVQMNEEICDEIFDLFEREGIPKTKVLIERAFYRYAFGQPILPIKVLEESKILETQEEEQIETVGSNKK